MTEVRVPDEERLRWLTLEQNYFPSLRCFLKDKLSDGVKFSKAQPGKVRNRL